MEHRWGQRFTVDFEVKIAARPFAVRIGRLTDLSVSGGAIQICADFRLLTRVQMAVVLPNRYVRPVPVVSGYVTRKFSDGIGIEWSEFAPNRVRDLLKVAHIGVRLPAQRAPHRPAVEMTSRQPRS
jgi:hypothetical protein